MENTVITQPQNSSKKKLVIGGVAVLVLVGLGMYMLGGNKSLYKGALVKQCDSKGNCVMVDDGIPAEELPPTPPPPEEVPECDSEGNCKEAGVQEAPKPEEPLQREPTQEEKDICAKTVGWAWSDATGQCEPVKAAVLSEDQAKKAECNALGKDVSADFKSCVDRVEAVVASPESIEEKTPLAASIEKCLAETGNKDLCEAKLQVAVKDAADIAPGDVVEGVAGYTQVEIDELACNNNTATKWVEGACVERAKLNAAASKPAAAATKEVSGVMATLPATKSGVDEAQLLAEKLKAGTKVTIPTTKVGPSNVETTRGAPAQPAQVYDPAQSYPEQPESLRRIKELEDALAAQDRARAAASAYGDNNNQMTPEQAAVAAAQAAAEARVAQADAMRAMQAGQNMPAVDEESSARTSKATKPRGSLNAVHADAVALAEGAFVPSDANNSADSTTVIRSARVSSASNASRTDAAAASRLHGAAIQGTSGPEVLLYPILVAAANGAYFSLRRRANRK